MLTGAEIIPLTVESALPLLHSLSDVLDIVKVRRREDADAILAAGLQFKWVLRPPSEGRNPDEVVRDATEWLDWIARSGQQEHVYRLLLSSEPNHPDSPYRGPSGANPYLREILLPALAELESASIPVGLSGMVPYYGSAEWAAMLDSVPQCLPALHVYQNLGDVAGAVADGLTQIGQKDVRLALADEVGDTGAGFDPDVRAGRIADQFRLLAQAGIAAAILFPLCGSADASISYPVETVRALLSAGRATTVKPKRPKRPKRTPEVHAVTLEDLQREAYVTTLHDREPETVNLGTGLADYWLHNKAQLGTPVTGEITLDDGRVAQRFATGRIALYDQGTITIV